MPRMTSFLETIKPNYETSEDTDEDVGEDDESTDNSDNNWTKVNGSRKAKDYSNKDLKEVEVFDTKYCAVKGVITQMIKN